MPRPFRFAVVARWAAGGRHWREVARRAGGLGYDIAAFPFLLYGSRASLRDLPRARRARFGINSVSVPGQAMDELAPLVEEPRGT